MAEHIQLRAGQGLQGDVPGEACAPTLSSLTRSAETGLGGLPLPHHKAAKCSCYSFCTLHSFTAKKRSTMQWHSLPKIICSCRECVGQEMNLPHHPTEARLESLPIPSKTPKSIWIHMRKKTFSFHKFAMQNFSRPYTTLKLLSCREIFSICQSGLTVTMPHSPLKMTKGGWPQLCTGFHQRANSSSVCN